MVQAKTSQEFRESVDYREHLSKVLEDDILQNALALVSDVPNELPRAQVGVPYTTTLACEFMAYFGAKRILTRLRIHTQPWEQQQPEEKAPAMQALDETEWGHTMPDSVKQQVAQAFEKMGLDPRTVDPSFNL